MDALKPEDLYRYCDAKQFSFESTADLASLEEAIGQPRAVEALRFGTGIEREGYNIFALGPPGTGKHSLVRQVLEGRATEEAAPSDWCYVNNFGRQHEPNVLCLPAGKGRALQQDMDGLIEEVRNALKAAFESEEYQTRRHLLNRRLRRRSRMRLRRFVKRPEFVMSREKLIKGLNEDLAAEWGTIMRYTYQASKSFGIRGMELRNLFAKEIQDEMGHASYLTDIIVDMGGEPTTTPLEFEKPDDLKAMLQLDFEMEQQDVKNYKEHAKLAGDLGEIELKLKLEDMAADESGHARELQRLIKGL